MSFVYESSVGGRVAVSVCVCLGARVIAVQELEQVGDVAAAARSDEPAREMKAA